MPPNSKAQFDKYDAIIYYELPGFSTYDEGNVSLSRLLDYNQTVINRLRKAFKINQLD